MAAKTLARLSTLAMLAVGCGGAEGGATLAAPEPRGDLAELARGAMRTSAVGTSDAPCASAGLPHDARPASLRSRFVYAANQNSHDVSAYRVETSGTLVPLGEPAAVGRYPQGLALLPSGKSLLVANRGSGTVSVLSVEEGGRLRSGADELTDAGSSPVAITSHPNGHLVFVGSDDASFSAKNTVTSYVVRSDGGLTRVAAVPTDSQGLLALTLDGTGRVLYSANALGDHVTAFRVEPCTGALTFLGRFPTAPFPVSLAVDDAGKRLYVASSAGEPSVQTFAIDPEAGELRLLSTLKVAFPAWSLRAMRLDAAGGALVLLSLGERGAAFISTLALDPETGQPGSAPVSSLAAGENAAQIALGPGGRFAYVGNFGSNDVSSYALDPARGTVQLLGSAPAGAAPSALAIAAGPNAVDAP